MRRQYLLWGVALICLGVLAYAFYLVFAPFFRSIAWAVILAVLLAPVHGWLGRWVRSRAARALVTCLLAAVLLLGPVLSLGTLLVGELVSAFRAIQSAVDSGAVANINPGNWAPVVWLRDTLDTWLSPLLPSFDVNRVLDLQQLDLEAIVRSAAQTLSQWLLGQTGAALSNLADLTFAIVVTWLTLYYLLKDCDRALNRFMELLPYPDTQKDAMLERLNEVVITSVYGGMAVAVAQGLMGGIAFAILGLPSPVLWGTVMTVLAFLPLVGAFVVWAPAALVLMAQGRWIAGLVMVAWGALVVGLIDNVLRPMLISGRTRMHPLLVFLSVIGGIQAFGFLGLFLGPLLVAVVTGVIELYRGVLHGDYGEVLERPTATAPES